MADQNDTDDIQAAWQSQPAQTRPALDEIHKVKAMEKKMRRVRYGLYVAGTLSSLVVLGIAAVFGGPVLIAGAVLLAFGFVHLCYELHRHAAAAPDVADGMTAAVDYHRALLQRQILFHRQGLWRRVFSLAPGGILFFLGFANAQPRLAPIIYLELATFVLGIVLIIPMNRRAARKLEKQLKDLGGLG